MEKVAAALVAQYFLLRLYNPTRQVQHVRDNIPSNIKQKSYFNTGDDYTHHYWSINIFNVISS
jgi:hypothetical protein